jgi:membrane protein implicated in regulation of membrane protease activity
VRSPSLVVGGAVVLCLPMLPGILSGALTTVPALERFLLALIVSWIAATLLSRVVTRYSNEARQAEIVKQLTEARGASSEPIHPDRVIPPR